MKRVEEEGAREQEREIERGREVAREQERAISREVS